MPNRYQRLVGFSLLTFAAACGSSGTTPPGATPAASVTRVPSEMASSSSQDSPSVSTDTSAASTLPSAPTDVAPSSPDQANGTPVRGAGDFVDTGSFQWHLSYDLGLGQPTKEIDTQHGADMYTVHVPVKGTVTVQNNTGQAASTAAVSRLAVAGLYASSRPVCKQESMGSSEITLAGKVNGQSKDFCLLYYGNVLTGSLQPNGSTLDTGTSDTEKLYIGDTGIGDYKLHYSLSGTNADAVIADLSKAPDYSVAVETSNNDAFHATTKCSPQNSIGVGDPLILVFSDPALGC